VAATSLQAAEPDREGEPKASDRIGVDLFEARESVALIILVNRAVGLHQRGVDRKDTLAREGGPAAA
jgi:hypothetical protein